MRWFLLILLLLVLAGAGAVGGYFLLKPQPTKYHPDFGTDCAALLTPATQNAVDCVRVLFGTNRDLVLEGQLPAAELELEQLDELIHVNEPMRYRLEVQLLEGGVLAKGELRLNLDCECVRCLKAFRRELVLAGEVCYLALTGEEKVAISSDSVDLTPHLREDILLEIPQHPLCKPDCGGLPAPAAKDSKRSGRKQRAEDAPSAWSALDKLKL